MIATAAALKSPVKLIVLGIVAPSYSSHITVARVIVWGLCACVCVQKHNRHLGISGDGHVWYMARKDFGQAHPIWNKSGRSLIFARTFGPPSILPLASPRVHLARVIVDSLVVLRVMVFLSVARGIRLSAVPVLMLLMMVVVLVASNACCVGGIGWSLVMKVLRKMLRVMVIEARASEDLVKEGLAQTIRKLLHVGLIADRYSFLATIEGPLHLLLGAHILGGRRGRINFFIFD